MFSMKYSYSPLTFEYVIGKLGIEKLYGSDKHLSLTTAAEEAYEIGFKAMELNMDIFQILSIPVRRDDLVRLGEFCKATGFSLSCHMPYYSIDLGGPNEHIRKGSVQALIKAYDEIKYLDPFIVSYVIHPADEISAEVINFFPPDFSRDIVTLLREYARLSLESFFCETGIAREKTVLENVRFPLEDTIGLVRDTGSRFCLDIAHLLGGFSGEYKLMDVLIEHYDLLGEIHLQEFDEKTEHTAVGAHGQITSIFFDYLYEKGFKGPLVFELPPNEVEISIKNIKEIYSGAAEDLPG